MKKAENKAPKGKRHKWNKHRRSDATCISCGCRYSRGVYTITYTMPDGTVTQNVAPECKQEKPTL